MVASSAKIVFTARTMIICCARRVMIVMLERLLICEI
jgi:hypothetical protein